MDPSLVDLTRRLAAGDPTARAELATQPGEMARALDEMVTVLERRTALLSEAEQYFDALAQQSLIGVYVAGHDRILYANETVARISGYSVEEITGRLILLEIVHPEDRPTVARNFERRFRGETFRASFRLIRRDGSIVLVETDGRRVVRRGEPVIIGTVHAVDTLRRGRTEARRQRQALFRSERMAGPGPVAEQAQRVAEQARRAGDIVRRFTAMTSDHPGERAPVSLNDVLRDVIDLFDHALKRARINVMLDLLPDLPTIMGDARRLHELAAHLITNALQAMRGRPAPRRLTLQTVAIPVTSHVAFEVSDTGPGLSADALAHLFEPFYTTKSVGLGTGLGLFVCLEIAREHRGSVAHVERPGPGATFRVELPERGPDFR